MDVTGVQAPFDPSAFDPTAFDVVLASSLRDTERTAPDRLLLTFALDAEPALRDITRRAPKEFDIRIEDGQLLAEVSVPVSDIELLDALAVRARTAELRLLRPHLDDGVPGPRAATA